MSLRVFLAVSAVKLSRLAIRLLGRGGTAMPGRIALKICPELLATLSKNVKVVAVTGTNGKTTSSRMIENAFAEKGLNYIANRSGANLLSGITTEFALNSTLTGRCRAEYAVIECDEAAARKTFGLLKPGVVVVTNLFRDQLDRYGEVTHTLDSIREGLKGAPEAVLCLNADCSLTSSLAGDLPNRAVFFGIEKGAAPSCAPGELSDATHCIRCKTEYEYDYVTYGHLGGFRCPKCGYHRCCTDIGVERIMSSDSSSTTVEMNILGRRETVRVNLPALYNVYNAAGAVAAMTQMGIDAETAVKAVGSFKCGFGRMESFEIGKKGAKLMLVKNPAGCNQVIEFLAGTGEKFELAVCLNDNGADGTDVSWIWDVDFERLAQAGDRITRILVSGIRARDMAVRLKYAGIPAERLEIITDYDGLCAELEKSDEQSFIIPTYTAMLDLRAKLVRLCGGSDFWEG